MPESDHTRAWRARAAIPRKPLEAIPDASPAARGPQPTRRGLAQAFDESASAERTQELAPEGAVRSRGEPLAAAFGHHAARGARHRAAAVVARRAVGVKIPGEAKYDLWFGWRQPMESR